MKTCKRCQSSKEDTEFYGGNDYGSDRTCKECRKSLIRADRKANVEHYREYDRIRNNLPHRVQARKDYAQSEQGKTAIRRGQRAWTARNPDKHAAHTILGNALRAGRITKPISCSKCEAKDVRIEGHHEDHAYPLQVIWLCPQCHRKTHQ